MTQPLDIEQIVKSNLEWTLGQAEMITNTDACDFTEHGRKLALSLANAVIMLAKENDALKELVKFAYHYVALEADTNGMNESREAREWLRTVKKLKLAVTAVDAAKGDGEEDGDGR